jgi:hypothetical protein
MPTTPNLGYGQASEVSLDHFNQYMRSSPWYQNLIHSFGQDPNNVHLSESQKQQVIRAAQANGAVIDEGKQEVDDSGNFRNTSHKLRNTLIVAGIAAATIATMGAAGVFAGAAGAAAGGGSAAGGAAAAGAGGTLAATTTVPLMAGTIGGSVASGAVPAALAAGTLGSTVGVGGTGGALAATGRFLGSSAGSSLAGTAGNVFSNIYGANKQADANSEAARLADEATKRAEQFSREQAEGAYQSNEHTQKANYDQWRAREDAIMGSLGHQLGINYTAPEYSPGIDPRYTGGAAAPTGTAPTGATADPAQAFIANWQRTHDPKEGIEPLAKAYKAAGFGDRFLVDGTTPSNNELVVGGQKYKVLSGENGASPSWYIPGSNDGGAAPVMRPSLATTFARPNFVPLPTPYQPGTLGAYVGS